MVPSLTRVFDPYSLLSSAVEQGADLDRLQKLMDLQERWEKSEAEKSYNLAVANFKANPPKIIMDMINPEYRSAYCSLSNLVNTANQSMSPLGLNIRWEFAQPDGLLQVTCILSHVQGHAERATLIGPSDTTGGKAKNPIQAMRSTSTYLRKLTFEAVTGLSADYEDQDGNESEIEPISQAQARSLNNLIKTTGTNLEQFLAYAKVDKIEDIPEPVFQHLYEKLKKKEKEIGNKKSDSTKEEAAPTEEKNKGQIADELIDDRTGEIIEDDEPKQAHHPITQASAGIIRHIKQAMDKKGIGFTDIKKEFGVESFDLIDNLMATKIVNWIRAK